MSSSLYKTYSTVNSLSGSWDTNVYGPYITNIYSNLISSGYQKAGVNITIDASAGTSDYLILCEGYASHAPFNGLLYFYLDNNDTAETLYIGRHYSLDQSSTTSQKVIVMGKLNLIPGSYTAYVEATLNGPTVSTTSTKAAYHTYGRFAFIKLPTSSAPNIIFGRENDTTTL